MDPFILKCTDPLPAEKSARLGKPGIFFDRDGTIIEEKNYLSDPLDLKILPSVPQGLRKLKFTGLPLYLFTNQAGVAHGFFDETKLREVHFYLIKELNRLKVNLRGILFCPHHPLAEIEAYRRDCFCRKPNPGLLLKAAALDQVELDQSYIIGDKLIDIEAGKKVGAKTILVLTGYGRKERAGIRPENTPDFVAGELNQAVNWILKDLTLSRRLIPRRVSNAD